ncbi:hypothetical protein BU26DRAFT_565088 [Trematosphaeria pertusa]|uniref:Uncharacterized protein n=1 Tax=Trematosphaeria pertusa TaxID=390896 RepID=A0A6A6IHB7_9PLEO|nr:uncharacterized protein BU26DRAFT_565088 [Trematosphaeria pertusa]KAF2249438.1 hypothetical protein BU26DRAFT_565088 [Trematosphaeria pertusa]
MPSKAPQLTLYPSGVYALSRAPRGDRWSAFIPADHPTRPEGPQDPQSTHHLPSGLLDDGGAPSSPGSSAWSTLANAPAPDRAAWGSSDPSAWPPSPWERPAWRPSARDVQAWGPPPRESSTPRSGIRDALREDSIEEDERREVRAQAVEFLRRRTLVRMSEGEGRQGRGGEGLAERRCVEEERARRVGVIGDGRPRGKEGPELGKGASGPASADEGTREE